MDDRIPALVGAVGGLSVVLATLAPYLLLPAAEASGLSSYYGAGVVGPWGVGVLSIVVAVAFLGASRDRTDPGLVAGTTLVVGVVVALLALEWALAVDPELVLSIGTADWLADHRWAVVALSVSEPVAAVWYARVTGFV